MGPSGPIGPMWTHIDPSGPKWAHVDPYGPNWTNVDPCGPKLTQVDPCGPKWTKVDTSGPRWSLAVWAWIPSSTSNLTVLLLSYLPIIVVSTELCGLVFICFHFCVYLGGMSSGKFLPPWLMSRKDWKKEEAKKKKLQPLDGAFNISFKSYDLMLVMI